MSLRPSYKTSIYLLFFATLLVVVTCAVCGNYYDGSDDAMISLLLRGKAGGVVVTDFPRFYHFISVPIAGLYNWQPGIAWHGIVMYVCLTIAEWLFLKILWTYFSEGMSLLWRLVIGVLFYYFFLMEHVMYLNFTRVAILLSAGSVLYALYLWHTYRKPSMLNGYVLLFFLAMCIRPNGALLAVIIILPVYALIARVTIRNWWPVPTVVLLIAGGIYLGLNLSGTSEESHLKHKNYLKSNVMDYGIVNDNNLTKREHLQLNAVAEGYIADDSITVAFMEKITADDRVSLFSQKGGKYARVGTQLGHKLIWDYAQVLFVFIITIGLCVFRNRQFLPQLFLALLYGLVLIYFIGVLYKIPDKVLGPALTILVLLFLKKLIQREKLPSSLKFMLIGTVLLCTLGYSVKQVHRVKSSKGIQQDRERLLAEIEAIKGAPQILTSRFSFVLMYLNPLKNYPVDFGDRFLSFTGWPTLLPDYKKLLLYQTQAKSFAQIFENTAGREAVFVFFKPSQAAFLEEYLMVIHGLSVKFTKLAVKKDPKLSQERYYYKVVYGS